VTADRRIARGIAYVEQLQRFNNGNPERTHPEIATYWRTLTDDYSSALEILRAAPSRTGAGRPSGCDRSWLSAVMQVRWDFPWRAACTWRAPGLSSRSAHATQRAAAR